MADLRDEWEDNLEPHFQAAGLSSLQRECWVMQRLDRLSPQQIRGILHLKRTQDVRDFIGQADAKLSGLPGFWDAARQFERDLMQVSANRDDHEHRPDGVRGVTPDRASDKLFGAKVVGFGDLRLRQDEPSAALLWARKSMPNRYDRENSIPAV